MNKLIRSFDMAAFKFGTCQVRYPERVIESPTRYEAPKDENFRALSQKERARKTLLSAIGILQRQRPDVVVIEDCTIQFVTKDAQGRTVFKSKGRQDYYVKGNIAVIEFYCECIAKPKIEVELVNIGVLKEACAGFAKASKDDVKEAMQSKYGIVCPTDDHSDAAALVDYYFLTH